jgi:hypothetical protein
MSTVFSSDSPVSPGDAQELSTLAAFIAHIERLQDQVRQKDATISELDADRAQLQERHDLLERDQKALGLQIDILNELMRKTGQSDSHIEQLRAAVIDRETIIGAKEKSIRILQRQLEHHKLLLQAQIRRNATMTLHVAIDKDKVPELSTLAKKDEIDKWVEGLQVRLRKEKVVSNTIVSSDPREATLANLRDEIDFYVREIILYKLDIRGYKSDIKKLKRITTQMSSYGSRASDLDSETSSLRPAATPSQARSACLTPDLGSSDVPSPVLLDSVTGTTTTGAPQPAPAGGSTEKSPTNTLDICSARHDAQLVSQDHINPQTPNREIDLAIEGEAERVCFGFSSISAKCSPATVRPSIKWRFMTMV